MTNYAQQLLEATTLYLLATGPARYDGSPALYLADQMGSYEADLYRVDLYRHGLDQLVSDEWNNVWTQGDNVFLTREAAEAALDSDEFGHGWYVIEITREDVAEALEREFGAPPSYPTPVAAFEQDVLTREADRLGVSWAREIAQVGEGNDRLRLVELDGGTRVILTNANPVWEEEDGFAGLAEAFGDLDDLDD